ncbi:MAG: short-chain dehydrogenase, partial [Gemmatimonadota bacterium]
MAPAARRVTLITGAAHGLGWALAQEAAGRGDALVLADRDAETLTARVTALGGIVLMPGTELPPEVPLHII